MGIPVVVIGKQHTCPEYDGKKPHVGGKVIEGTNGVFIDGMPVAVEGSKCQCCSPKMNQIVSGAAGILIDGKVIAILGSQTEHGGKVVEGVSGVTVSGGFSTRSEQFGDFEPRIFNLQWKKNDRMTSYGKPKDKIILSADTVGYEEGDIVKIKIYNKGFDEPIDEVEGIVKDGRVEVEWDINYKDEDDGE